MEDLCQVQCLSEMYHQEITFKIQRLKATVNINLLRIPYVLIMRHVTAALKMERTTTV